MPCCSRTFSDFMIPPEYHAYHEAGHTLALHCSSVFDVDYIELDDPRGYFVRNKWRGNEEDPPSCLAHLEKVFVAFAGEYSGRRYLLEAGHAATNSEIEEGLTNDRNSAESQLAKIALQNSRTQLRLANERFFAKRDVWAGVHLVAKQILVQKSGRIMGDEVSTRLNTLIPTSVNRPPIPLQIIWKGVLKRFIRKKWERLLGR